MPRINREIRSADRDYDEKMAIFKSLNLPFLRRDNREEYLRLLGAETHIRLCYEHQSEFLYGIKGQQEKIDEWVSLSFFIARHTTWISSNV